VPEPAWGPSVMRSDVTIFWPFRSSSVASIMLPGLSSAFWAWLFGTVSRVPSFSVT
jgi:hypothetical protein